MTVLVPSHLCGVAVRRALARGLDGRSGVAGLSVLTVDRLAERLAAPALVGSGRRPVTDGVLTAAWRRVLAERPGVFAPVAAHPATVRALVAAHRELREVDDAGLAAIVDSGDPVASEVGLLHQRVVNLLADDWYDVTSLRETAAIALQTNPAYGAEIGAVIMFLPQDIAPGPFVGQLVVNTDLTVIAALAGHERADAAVHRTIRRVSTDDAPSIAQPTAVRIAHASDADDEVRCAVRELTATLRDIPAHRVAVLYGAADPYARILAEHIDAAGIVWNGAGVRPTLERTLPRAMLDLLALPDHRWRRDEVLSLVSAAPVRNADGDRVPAARWDRISRAAGVVAGDEWDTRLKSYAAHLHASADAERAADEPRQWLIDRRERDATTAMELHAFVGDLRRRSHHGASLHTWPDLSRWAVETFAALVGDLDGEAWLPEDEARAADRIARTLQGLASLDSIEEYADLTALRLTLDLELADDLPRYGRAGTGVLLAPLAAAVGLDVDAVIVVGVAEDLVPGRIRADALLPDRVRALAGGQLPLSRDRVDRVHRHLLAALAAAPDCLVSFPRGDLRQSAPRLPSRWLLPSLRALAGDDQVQATGWADVPGLAESRSFTASLTSADVLATEQEWRTRACLSAGAVVDALPDDEVVAAAIAMRRGHAAGRLTRFDGDLAGLDLPDPSQGRIVSATSLERWATCPHAYFVGSMLRVEPIDSPEELLQISARDVGSLIHETLDRFVREQFDAGTVPAGPTPWNADQRARLRQIAADVAEDFVAHGTTGHPLLWRQEKARILADLDTLLDDDDRVRAETGRRQVRSELMFGLRGEQPLDVALADGRVIRFRGSADRVDRVGDGLVIVDYKTGRARDLTKLSETNPTLGGTKLQLPVYAYAARAALDVPAGPVSAEYWFLGKDRRRVNLPLTPDVQREYTRVLTIIVDGMSAGLFPHRPPPEDSFGGFITCRYCEPDGLGVGEHRERWTRKRHDPRLADYVRLTEPSAADDG
ncbi:PD-(D/E)XK nuclease family protein [Luedemannella flava]|uniref:PD-(D/E)XK nuclease family protein n=1 Tax=Luedemannella flava TaxID=349316 RepID=UPI0031E1FB57